MLAAVSVYYHKLPSELEELPLSEIALMFQWTGWIRSKENEAVKDGGK